MRLRGQLQVERGSSTYLQNVMGLSNDKLINVCLGSRTAWQTEWQTDCRVNKDHNHRTSRVASPNLFSSLHLFSSIYLSSICTSISAAFEVFYCSAESTSSFNCLSCAVIVIAIVIVSRPAGTAGAVISDQWQVISGKWSVASGHSSGAWHFQ